MSDKSRDFEQSIQRLDEIVRQMEQGNVPLAESLKLFEEGTALVTRCSSLLDEAELKVVQLTKGPDGEPVETEFENGDEL